RASIVARHDCEDGSIEEAMDGIRKLAETCAAELEQRGVSGKLIELTLIWEERALPSFPLLHDEERIADDSRRALPRVESRIEGGGPLLPVPYRVHSSRLPHPPLERDMARRDGTESLVKRGEGTPPARVEHHPADGGHSTKAVSTVRTPIGTAPPLFECARRLLMQNWPRAGSGENLPRLQAIELEVREFTKPAQLSFPDFDRLDQTGSLRGLSAERRQALLENDEVFQARYGTTAFQHVAAIDPGNILTERRFHWKNGLPWENGTAKRRRS
ncbi:MAG TPA: hypothetical protein VF221_14910, partial [Chloroflexota bacterium]